MQEKLVHGFVTFMLEYCNALLAGCSRAPVSPECSSQIILSLFYPQCSGSLNWKARKTLWKTLERHRGVGVGVGGPLRKYKDTNSELMKIMWIHVVAQICWGWFCHILYLLSLHVLPSGWSNVDPFNSYYTPIIPNHLRCLSAELYSCCLMRCCSWYGSSYPWICLIDSDCSPPTSTVPASSSQSCLNLWLTLLL